MPYSTFSYLYRDAANYKQFNRVLLKGRASQSDHDAITGALHEGDYFIADVVGLPSLQERWAELASFPTPDDHLWHEFVSLAPASEDDRKQLTCWGEKDSLIGRFTAVEDWDFLLQEALLRDGSLCNFAE